VTSRTGDLGCRTRLPDQDLCRDRKRFREIIRELGRIALGWERRRDTLWTAVLLRIEPVLVGPYLGLMTPTVWGREGPVPSGESIV